MPQCRRRRRPPLSVPRHHLRLLFTRYRPPSVPRDSPPTATSPVIGAGSAEDAEEEHQVRKRPSSLALPFPFFFVHFICWLFPRSNSDAGADAFHSSDLAWVETAVRPSVLRAGASREPPPSRRRRPIRRVGDIPGGRRGPSWIEEREFLQLSSACGYFSTWGNYFSRREQGRGKGRRWMLKVATACHSFEKFN